ncbi:hypothetical protein [Roseibium sp. RKSG952]|uniref:hypothetical protein n=1 Tax=Roseibium sp. RKSG952 TaxID=2529384 RepID=UPI0012BC16D9|nr:hypothetical protein [Roseibium sp. RKSG952]MTI00222.1 hypothetical protein [Roseibium sp. RKSG952]
MGPNIIASGPARKTFALYTPLDGSGPEDCGPLKDKNVKKIWRKRIKAAAFAWSLCVAVEWARGPYAAVRELFGYPKGKVMGDVGLQVPG